MDEMTFCDLRNAINELARRIGEIMGDLAEIIDKILKGNIKNVYKEYKFVKKLIKPYEQPIIKIKAKARSNL